MMIPDPTEEIKTIRHRLGAELGFDLHKIIADTRSRQSDSGRTYIRLPSRKPQITFKGLDSAVSGEGGSRAG
jgi:F420-0:gamma-glutamyl ligase